MLNCHDVLVWNILRFVEQWVFLGQLDWGEEFGIHRDQHALNRRGMCIISEERDFFTFVGGVLDEEYWRSGYVMATSCSPSFLRCHDNTLLTAGKALNLLKLCSPKVQYHADLMIRVGHFGQIARCPAVHLIILST